MPPGGRSGGIAAASRHGAQEHSMARKDGWSDEEEERLEREKSSVDRKNTLKAFRKKNTAGIDPSALPLPADASMATMLVLKEIRLVNQNMEELRDEIHKEIKVMKQNMHDHAQTSVSDDPALFIKRLESVISQGDGPVNLGNQSGPVPTSLRATEERQDGETRLAHILAAAAQKSKAQRFIEANYNTEHYVPPVPSHPANQHQFVIRGQTLKKELKILWTQDDHAMVWGLVPILNGGAFKYFLEIVTLLLVLLSVLVIVIQSYDAFDPDRCPIDKFAPGGPSIGDVLVAVERYGPWASSTTATTTTTTTDLNAPEADAGAAGADGSLPMECTVQLESEIAYTQIFLIAWFTAEYILRWTSVRPDWKIRRPYTRKDFWVAKFKYSTSFMPLIDLLSILPFYLSFVISTEGGVGHVLMILRVVRVMRIFKVTQQNRTITDVIACLKRIVADLAVFFVVILTLVILMATTMYYVEKGNEEGWFTSIPECMYWCVITFTSVGYGDRYPISDGGRLVAAIASLVGTIMMNFPIALIILSFDEVYNIRKQREERANKVVQRLFKWSSRHKGKYAHLSKPSDTPEQPQGKRKRAKWLWNKSRRNTVKDTAGGPVGQTSSGTSLAKFSKKQAVKNRRNRRVAMKRLQDLILHPHHRHKRVGNGAYNGRDHYLASKFSTKWMKATVRGRQSREKAYEVYLTKRQSQLGIPPQITEQGGPSKAAERRPSSKFVSSSPQTIPSVPVVPLTIKIASDEYDHESNATSEKETKA